MVKNFLTESSDCFGHSSFTLRKATIRNLIYSILQESQRKTPSGVDSGNLADHPVGLYPPIQEFGNISSKIERTAHVTWGGVRWSWKPDSARDVELLTGHKAAAFDSNQLLYLLHCSNKLYLPPYWSAQHTRLLLTQWSSGCWIFLWFSMPQIRVLWVLANPERWENNCQKWRSDVRMRNRTTCCSYSIEKRPLVKYNNEEKTDVLLLFYLETCELDFQDVLHDRVGNPRICSCSPHGPCWMLLKLGIDCWHCLLGDCHPLSLLCLILLRWLKYRIIWENWCLQEGYFCFAFACSF